ncbi:hypothetical protein [Phycicoccus sp. Soil802]|uniref:hypothetical protein n=1 Tax=Phycicoccus sp. Soil802 TaxID=1736414 RepID=UPI0007034F6C|nr:hypothetical protein [Phycicoccus sp. Soil802]KRF28951.1 hypothetical protein ASG91_04790 [Phycicoccus sp. Soil802]
MTVLKVDERKAALGDILHALNHFTWDLERDGWEREAASVDSAICVLQSLSVAIHHVQLAIDAPAEAERRYGIGTTLVVGNAPR